MSETTEETTAAVAAMKVLVNWRDDDGDESELTDAQWNRRVGWHLFRGVLDWRMLLVPISVPLGDYFLKTPGAWRRVTYRSVHVFGFRIARWVVTFKDYKREEKVEWKIDPDGGPRWTEVQRKAAEECGEGEALAADEAAADTEAGAAPMATGKP